MMECDVSKKRCGRAQKLADQRFGLSGRGRQRKQLCQSDRPERSHVVWASVLQVVELQLQLAYSHVLGGQLILQPPQLILLPEEHPQELMRRQNADLQQESGTLFYFFFKVYKILDFVEQFITNIMSSICAIQL